jgi:hypothetical protein
MAKPKDKAPIVTARDVASTGAAMTVAAGKAMALDPTGATLLVGVLLAFLPPAVALATEAGGRRLKERADRFFETLAKTWALDEGKTIEEVAATLEARIEKDPKASDAVWRAVRGLLEAPTEEATVVLGALAAEYIRDEAKADHFFRSVVRLMGDADGDELRELLAVLDWTLATTLQQKWALEAHDVERRGEQWAAIPWTMRLRLDLPMSTEVVSGPDGADWPGRPRDGQRLIGLLRSSGLGTDPGLAIVGKAAPGAELTRPVTTRLVRLLRLGLG